jgi:hypothetical protein
MSSERGINDLPERLHGFALMHVAMRRDAGRLVTVAATLTPSASGPVSAWWRRFQAVVEHHHRAEDGVFFPAVAARSPQLTTAGVLAEDHGVLDAAMRSVSAALEAGGADALEAARRFQSLLHDHLSREEATVFPAAARIPAAEYQAIEGRLVATAPLAVLSFLQPWMFDGVDPATVRRVSADIPPPARLLGRTVWRLRYDRLVAPVRRAA